MTRTQESKPSGGEAWSGSRPPTSVLTIDEQAELKLLFHTVQQAGLVLSPSETQRAAKCISLSRSKSVRVSSDLTGHEKTGVVSSLVGPESQASKKLRLVQRPLNKLDQRPAGVMVPPASHFVRDADVPNELRDFIDMLIARGHSTGTIQRALRCESITVPTEYVTRRVERYTVGGSRQSANVDLTMTYGDEDDVDDEDIVLEPLNPQTREGKSKGRSSKGRTAPKGRKARK
jgi:hypothetical protein